jgi:hypothetical protein
MSAAFSEPDKPIAAKPKSRWRRWFKWLLIVISIICVLTLSFTPTTPPTPPPTAAQVVAARASFMRLRSAAGSKEPVSFPLRWDEIEASAALLGRAAKIDRLAIAQNDKTLGVTASIPVFSGLWINLAAHIRPSDAGLPPIALKVGSIPIPAFAVRSAADLARLILGWRGVTLPELDTLVQALSLSNQGVTAKLMIPKGSNLYSAINQAQRAPVNTQAVGKIYCSLSALQQRVPTRDFALHVRRAFAVPASAISDVEQNRAAMIALAMFAVSPEVGNMAGDATQSIDSCPGPGEEVLLLGRPDLAKHWSLSAALTATFGSDISQAMGTWKEVADSGAAGSGFSFIDLAADRSGIAFAERAAAEETASATRARLQRIDENQLLPIAALAFTEGLTESQFQARYTNVDSSAYDTMVLKIDMILAQQNPG